MELDSDEEDMCSGMESEEASKPAEDSLDHALDEGFALQMTDFKSSSSRKGNSTLAESNVNASSSSAIVDKVEQGVNDVQSKTTLRQVVDLT